MPQPAIPRIVPYGADQTVYLVVDSFGSRNAVYREAEFERADLDTAIGDLLGHFDNPVRVISYNTLEHWTKTSRRRSPPRSSRAATSTASPCRSI